ncbi:hypothetical protein GCM10027422_11160 [Hymenobacter arcticus]
MQAFFLLLLAGLGWSQLANAQQAISQAATAEQRLAEDLGVDRLRNALLPAIETRTSSVLLQTGTGNVATIGQASQGTAPNQALVVQAGLGNALTLTQVGFDNQTTLSQMGNANKATLHQSGSSNAIDGLITGDDNTLGVQQQGQRNRYLTQLAGNNGRYNIEQIGSDNSFTQRETSASTPLPGYSVQQQGAGMRLTIEQGKVFP